MDTTPDRGADPGGSVSALVAALRGGDRAAADRLWGRYFARMAALARRRLCGTPPAVADEEDVALSAFLSFCRGAGGGAFPRALDRSRVWGLLASITAHKAADLVNHEGRQKRGGGLARRGAAELHAVEADAPPPDAVAAAAEDFQRLLARLGDPDLQAVALLRMEGYTAAEIADRLGCVPRTVERRLRVIRCLLAEGGGP